MKQELWSICFSQRDLVPPHLCHIQHLTGFRRGFHRFKASSGASSSPGSCVGGPRRWYVVKWSLMPQNGPHIQTSLHIQQLAAFFFSCGLLIGSEATEEAKTFESPLIAVATGCHLGIKCHCLVGVVLDTWEKCLSWVLLYSDTLKWQQAQDVPEIHSWQVPAAAPSLPAQLCAVSCTSALVCARMSIPACAGLCFRHRYNPAHVGELLLGLAAISQSCYCRRWWSQMWRVTELQCPFKYSPNNKILGEWCTERFGICRPHHYFQLLRHFL